MASLAILPAGQAFSRTIAAKTATAPQAVAPVTNDTGTSSTTVATDPVGYTTTTLQANSDTLVSIPLTRPAAYTGAIASISGNTITLSGTPGFTASQFVYASNGVQPNTYYAIVGPLLTSLANTVTVTNGSTSVAGSGFTASGIAAGDELIVNGLAYNVASVTSDTALVLSRAYAGTTPTAPVSASFDHSPKEGSYYTVTANSTGSLTVNLNGDSLSTVAAGTSLSLIPYWTLGTAFPASDSGVSYVPTTGKNPATQILIPDTVRAGINLAASTVYYYASSGWRLLGGDSGVAYDDTVLPPTEPFIVRNTATGTTFTPSGGVYMNRLAVPLATQTSTAQDNAVAVVRPASVTLNDLGVVASGAFVPTTGKTLMDQLLVFDNSVTGINKAATAVYYYDTAWRLVGGVAGTDYGSTSLNYGTGIIIRKAASTSGATAFWQNTRNY